MNKILPLLLLLGITCGVAKAQHYQRTISEITSCGTLSCIDGIRSKHKNMKEAKPLVRSLSQGAERVLLDFSIPLDGQKEKQKSFRLSMLVQQDSIRFGQLEQWENGQLEATYLFINDHEFLGQHVAAYNKANKANNSYKDLMRSIISREPIFWMWIE